ncbi:MAG TPA: two-component regulator propeller domain-containing protein, partial [Chryseosolibacter sp.]|nr:two-component regulator propeller domain-containing protein [Chryseosolibacter sp.]
MVRLVCILMILVAAVSTGAGAQNPSLFFANLFTRDGLPSNIISAVAQDKNDFIWIGTGNGLCRFDGYRFRTFKRQETENSLPANEISSLLVDGDYLWVGTWRGLCKINTRTFEVSRIDVGKSNVIRTLYRSKSGEIWIGTASGLIRYKNGQQVLYTRESSGLSHNTIRSIFEDAAGDLWVGTYHQLNRLDHGTDQFTAFDLKGSYKRTLQNNLICDIKPVQNNDSLLWVGTETGLVRFNRITNSFQHFTSKTSGFSNEVIKNIYTAPDGRLWLGTDFGLNIFDPATGTNTALFHNPKISYSIPNNVIWEIFEDTGGVVWLVTSNGLSRLNKHNHHFTYHEVTHQIDDQTVGNQVKSILVSRQGAIWIASLHGVLKIEPGSGKRKLFHTQSPESERILLNNVFTLEEDDLGRIWIGTAGGINVWDERTGRMYSITAHENNGL